MSRLQFNGIGLAGSTVGTVAFKADGLEWRDRAGMTKEVLKENMQSLHWSVFGGKGHVRVTLKDESQWRLDGFARTDEDAISKFASENFGQTLIQAQVHSGGGNYGNISLEGSSKKSILLTSISGKPIFELPLVSLYSDTFCIISPPCLVPLDSFFFCSNFSSIQSHNTNKLQDNVALCVVPTSNRDEMEVQFRESDNADKEEDGLAQITFHFAPQQDENEEESAAEIFKKAVMNSGIIQSMKDKVIVEFTKDEGNFVTPRGKYGIQMTATHMHMQGAQYFYKIKYTDINSLFLLPKPDGGRMAFVISLEKPIRQGTQKYQHLVIETHKVEHTKEVNLTPDEIKDEYEGLSPSMTMPMSSLMAKIFKILSQTAVYVPKSFASSRELPCVRCNIKASDGLLYPLAKSLIFINKPTIILSYSDIESVEMLRYEDTSGTRNFDLKVTMKANASSEGKDFVFQAIDRTEYSFLYDFLESRQVKMLNDKVSSADARKAGLAAMLGEEDDDDDSEEDDGDYEGGSQSDIDDSSDDSDSDSDNESGGSDGEKKKKKKKRDREEKASSKRPKEKKSPKPKKARKAKDKNAPKKALSAFMFFCNSERSKIRAEQPSLSITEVSKILGERWKELSSDDKKPFEEQAKEDKERYSEEMKNYVPPDAGSGDEGGGSDDDDGPSTKKAKKESSTKKPRKVKDKNEPKKNVTSFVFFGNDMRAKVRSENPGMSMTEVTKELGRRWKELPEEERKQYEQLAKADKERYMTEMDIYKAKKREAMEIDDGGADDDDGSGGDDVKEVGGGASDDDDDNE